MSPTKGGLDVGSFDAESIKSNALKDLLDVIDSVRGKKALVIDPSLTGPLGLIAKFSLLRDHGVDKVFHLDPNPLSTPQDKIIYLVRPQQRNAELLVDQIKKHSSEPSPGTREYHVYFVPRKTTTCTNILEDSGVLGDVVEGELPLLFIPLEQDLLSLELDDSFAELYFRGDLSSISTSAQALMHLQQLHGIFPRLTGKGDKAKILADMLLRLRQETAIDNRSNHSLQIGRSQPFETLIILDRETDFVTPLLTQLTYEGLVDEKYGIKNTLVEVDSSLYGAAPNTPSASSSSATPPQTSTARTRKQALNSTDQLYASLRDVNFAIVGNLLNKVARRLSDDYEGRHQAKTVAQIKDFVSKLSGLQAEHQSLRLHTNLAEEIMTYTAKQSFNKSLEIQQNLVAGFDPNSQTAAIEDLMAKNIPIASILRILCLQNLVGGNLKSKDVENLRRRFLQSYGYEHLLTLDALVRVGLLQGNTSANKSSFPSLRKSLRLIVDEVNEQKPDDIAYVYSGYAPLSIRLVQCIIQKHVMLATQSSNGTQGRIATTLSAVPSALGWRGFEEPLKLVNGKTFDEIQKQEDKAVRAKKLLNGAESKTTVVFFLGGCTYTEIAALRFIAKNEGKRIIIATTGIVNGNTIVNAALAEITSKRVEI